MKSCIAVFTVMVHFLVLCPAPAAMAAAAAAKRTGSAAKSSKPAAARPRAASTTSASAASKTSVKPALALLPVAGDGADATTRSMLGQFLRKRITDSGFAMPAEPAVRSALTKIAAEGSVCLDAECAVRAGRELAAHRVVLALVSESGGRARLELSAVEVASGEETFSEFGDAPNEDALMMILAPLVDRLITHLKEAPEPSPDAPAASEAPIAAKPAAPTASRGATGRASTLRIEHEAVTAAEPDQAIAIDVRVIPSLGSNMLFVLHRTEGEPSFKLVRMAPVESDILHAEIPAAAAGTRIEYCIRALDASGKQVARNPVGEAFFDIVVAGDAEPPSAEETPSPAPVSEAVGEEPSTPKSSKAAAKAEKKERERAAKAAARADRAAAKAEKATSRGKSKEAPVAAEVTSGKRKGSKKWLWIGAGVAVAGLGAALGGGGGGGGGPSGPPPGPAGTLPQPPGRP